MVSQVPTATRPPGATPWPSAGPPGHARARTAGCWRRPRRRRRGPQGELPRVPLPEVHVGGDLTRHLEHEAVDVDADHPAGGPDQAPGLPGGRTGTAADIEHAAADLRVRAGDDGAGRRCEVGRDEHLLVLSGGVVGELPLQSAHRGPAGRGHGVPPRPRRRPRRRRFNDATAGAVPGAPVEVPARRKIRAARRMGHRRAGSDRRGDGVATGVATGVRRRGDSVATG